uniref:Adenylate kinase isoenzyme 6 homolog n=1 Tax=Vannella robusta TaxID=1487602 RepID=A0A7S4HIJ6_9EUKA|mmetsp:Transcript_11122/g.13763  ORF Transcript_11122/g.13763 Transcript_11122/m.13763 type:complete len:167 (+) Transcript_11122:197-697(+)
MSRPNILITGTPGTGKSTTAESVALNTGLRHVELSQLVKTDQLYSEFDEEYNSYVIDEDKVCDTLEPIMQQKGVVVDYHGSDFFPERWFDLVVVLRADNTVLYDRLKARGYHDKKITENVECEIMQVLLDEAKDSYREDIIWVLQSDNTEQLLENVQKIEDYINNY